MGIFWERFEWLCAENNVMAKDVAEAVGVSSAAVTGWKKGSIPNAELLASVADYFNVTSEYLLDNEEIAIKPSLLKTPKYGAFRSLCSIPQRFFSLKHGEMLDDVTVQKILKFISVSLMVFGSKTSYDDLELTHIDNWTYDQDILEKILGIMDLCPDSEQMKKLQELLSRVVLHWVDEKLGEKYSLLSDEYSKIDLMSDKLRYLYHDDISGSLDWKYGLNFTELNTIREKYGISFPYMFTGHELSDVFAERDAQIAERDARIAELEARIKQSKKVE